MRFQPPAVAAARLLLHLWDASQQSPDGEERLGEVSRENAAGFGAVFEAVKRVVAARGVRHAGEPLITYAEAGVTLTRTPLNEYEVRTDAGVVFRARHTGALSSDPVFTPGDWIEEVKRMDREVRKGGMR